MRLVWFLLFCIFCSFSFSTPIDDIAQFMKDQFDGVDAAEIHRLLRKLIDDMGLTGELKDVILGRKLDIKAHIDAMAKCANANNYLVQAASVIQNKGLHRYLLQKPQEEIQRTIQLSTIYAFLIDTLVNEATSDTAFFQRMFDALGTNLQHTHNKFDTFQKVKLISVRKGLQLVLRELNSGQPADTLANRLVLPINVMEAVMQDRHLGLYDNADAGMPLANYNPTSKPNAQTGSGPRSLSTDGRVVEVHYPLGVLWDDLYSTWNMGFCANHNNFPFYFAKLMNPAVGCYQDKPSQYLMKRGIGLYVHLTFGAHFANKNITPYSSIQWYNETLTKEFGRMNKVSSRHYASSVDRLDPSNRLKGLPLMMSAQKEVSQMITAVENAAAQIVGVAGAGVQHGARAVASGARRGVHGAGGVARHSANSLFGGVRQGHSRLTRK